jgi:hypothetical protein
VGHASVERVCARVSRVGCAVSFRTNRTNYARRVHLKTSPRDSFLEFLLVDSFFDFGFFYSGFLKIERINSLKIEKGAPVFL